MLFLFRKYCSTLFHIFICAVYHQECMQKIKVEQHAMCGGLWFIGWMFTIGILDLDFWRGVLALVIWPYYLGHALTALL